MKSKLAILLSLTLAASAALATGKPDIPSPSPAPSSNSDSSSNSTSGAVAGANATGGDSSSTSSGGAGGNSSASATSGDSYSASKSGDVTSNYSSKYLNLPQPVWTSVPTPYGCLVTESKALAGGWNFVSGSSTKQYSDSVCTTIRMAEAAMLHCQFETAAYLNKQAFESMYKDAKGDFFLSGNPENLGPVACDDLKRPKLRVETQINFPVEKQEVAPVATNVCAEPQKVYIKQAKKKPAKVCK